MPEKESGTSARPVMAFVNHVTVALLLMIPVTESSTRVEEYEKMSSMQTQTLPVLPVLSLSYPTRVMPSTPQTSPSLRTRPTQHQTWPCSDLAHLHEEMSCSQYHHRPPVFPSWKQWLDAIPYALAVLSRGPTAVRDA